MNIHKRTGTPPPHTHIHMCFHVFETTSEISQFSNLVCGEQNHRKKIVEVKLVVDKHKVLLHLENSGSVNYWSKQDKRQLNPRWSCNVQTLFKGYSLKRLDAASPWVNFFYFNFNYLHKEPVCVRWKYQKRQNSR